MRYLYMLLSIALLLAVLAGCSSSGGGAPYTPPDQTAPKVGECKVTPPTADWRGGRATVQVQASDDTGVTSVIARISGPNATTDAIPISRMPGVANYFVGNVPVPANMNSDGTANTYFITVWALDAAGNSGAYDQSISFTIPAPEGPIAPPAW